MELSSKLQPGELLAVPCPALITGAGTGIGRAAALALAGEGFQLVLTGRRLGPLEETQRQTEAQGVRARAVIADIGKPDSVRALFAKRHKKTLGKVIDACTEALANGNTLFFFGNGGLEPQIHLAQILVTPHPDPNVRNLRSDKAQNPEQAKAKIAAIRRGISLKALIEEALRVALARKEDTDER